MPATRTCTKARSCRATDRAGAAARRAPGRTHTGIDPDGAARDARRPSYRTHALLLDAYAPQAPVVLRARQDGIPGVCSPRLRRRCDPAAWRAAPEVGPTGSTSTARATPPMPPPRCATPCAPAWSKRATREKRRRRTGGPLAVCWSRAGSGAALAPPWALPPGASDAHGTLRAERELVVPAAPPPQNP